MAVETNTSRSEILDEVKSLLNKKENDAKSAGRRKELLAMIEEEIKNVVISNLAEAAAISPDSAIQLVLGKIFTDEADMRPFLHATLEIINFYRAGEVNLLKIMKFKSM